MSSHTTHVTRYLVVVQYGKREDVIVFVTGFIYVTKVIGKPYWSYRLTCRAVSRCWLHTRNREFQKRIFPRFVLSRRLCLVVVLYLISEVKIFKKDS
jgi:hypothetical protein